MTYDCQALHGDITQANRESTLAGFKKGSFKVRSHHVMATAICQTRYCMTEVHKSVYAAAIAIDATGG